MFSGSKNSRQIFLRPYSTRHKIYYYIFRIYNSYRNEYGNKSQRKRVRESHMSHVCCKLCNKNKILIASEKIRSQRKKICLSI